MGYRRGSILEDKKSLFTVLFLLNIAAVLIGLFFYLDQLSQTPLLLAIFVPDCPLFVFFAILVILRVAKSEWFTFLAAVGMVKYGLWTVFVLFYFNPYYFQPFLLPVTVVFVLGHMGMALEGLAIIPKRLDSRAVLIALAVLLVFDFSDYVLGTMPIIPIESSQDFALVAGLTISSSFILCAALFYFREKISQLLPVKFTRGIIES